MSNFDAQTLVAVLCVAVAVVVLCRRVVLWWKGQSGGCGNGCHGCGPKPTPPKFPLSVIDPEIDQHREQ